MDMDVASWSQLPLALAEKVLSLVPVPDLCRYQSVCKEWNTLICNPAFATLHAQNSKRRGASFIAMEIEGLETSTWCLLDLNARRWYKFRGDIITHCRITSLSSRVAAMDGGLVCRFAKTEPPMLSIFVHDLLGHSIKTLPLIRRHLTSQRLPSAHMMVDSTSHHFTVFLLNQDFDLRYFDTPGRIASKEQLKFINDPLMHIYNSATGEWRSASNPPWITKHEFYKIVDMVMCQSLLYILVNEYDQWIAIYYNPAEDAWKRTNFCLRRCDTLYPQLIAINTRLFVALWRITSENCGPRGCTYDFEVSEIIIPQMTLELLFKLPMFDVLKLLEISRWENFDFYEENPRWIPWYLEMNVNGVDNTLFVHSWLSAKAKAFDLDTRSWDHGIPKHPLGHLCSTNGPYKIAKHMDVLLPNSIQYLI